MSQLNMSYCQRFDSLSLGERAVALRPGNVGEVPHPNPLPQGEGASQTGHTLLTA